MSLVQGAVLFVAVLAFVIWRLSVMDTAPKGFVRLASYNLEDEASRARAALEDAGLSVTVYDHQTSLRARWAGVFLLYVPVDQAGRAAEILRPLASGRSGSPG